KGLGDDEYSVNQAISVPESVVEETIRLGRLLVSPAAQRDPAAAIDEQPSGSGGGAGGTVPAVRQRTSRSDSGRSSRSDRREGLRCHHCERATDPRPGGA